MNASPYVEKHELGCYEDKLATLCSNAINQANVQ